MNKQFWIKQKLDFVWKYWLCFTSHDWAGTYPMTAYLSQTFFSTLNYDTGTFVVWDIELIERYWKLFLCNDIEVEPGTEQIIEAKLQKGFEHNTNTPGILEE